jgi:hypothetical protein
MQLSESQLRTVIREELTQYLVEQGFLQRVGSGIKSAYQKLTGGSQKTNQPSSQSNKTNVKNTTGSLTGFERFTPTEEQQKEFEDSQTLAASRDKQRKDKIKHDVYYADAYAVRRGDYIPIQAESDIKKAIQKYKTFHPARALSTIFNHLIKSIENKDSAISQNEKQIYSVFISEIEKAKQKPAGLNENDRPQTSLDNQQLDNLKKQLIIPNTLLGKTVLAFEEFIIDDISEKLSLHRLFNNTNVKDSFQRLKNVVNTKQQSTTLEEQFFGKGGGGLQERMRKLKRIK